MGKTLYLILLCLMLAPAALAATYQTSTAATTAVANVCYTTDQLTAQIRDCEAKGMTYSTYYTGNCKYVKCVEKPTTTTATQTTTTATNPCPTSDELTTEMKRCEAAGMTYTTYIEGNCKYIKCVEKETSDCPTEEELQRKIANCPDDFVTSMDDNGCKIKYCPPVVACPTDDELQKRAAQCPDNYQKFVDNNGCTQVACKTDVCPNADEAARKCKAANMDYDAITDESGCKRISCRNNEKVECKKYVSNGCVIISCIDGWTFNSCQFCGNTKECKSYTDQDGCAVRECSDGTSTKACPVTAVAPVGVASATSGGAAIPTEETATAPVETNPKKVVDEAKQATQLNPQPEPPAPTKGEKASPKLAEGKPSSGDEAVQLNPQPEPPKPAGFFGKIGAWFQSWFK